MSERVADILKRIALLNREERMDLLYVLSNELKPDAIDDLTWDEAWAIEAERRYNDLEREEASTVSAEAVFAEARTRAPK